MIINVVLRNIDSGIPQNVMYCPVARAISEMTGKPVALVENGVVYNLETRTIFGYLPEEARKKYIKFDHTGFMKPFSFEMQIANSVSN